MDLFFYVFENVCHRIFLKSLLEIPLILVNDRAQSWNKNMFQRIHHVLKRKIAKSIENSMLPNEVLVNV